MTKPLIEVLTFEGCPHAQPAMDLVEQIMDELGIAAQVRRVDVVDPEMATAHRFLGSPTIRVNGGDIEPGADERSEFVLSCRIYRTRSGVTGEPDARWLREALSAAA